MINLTLVCLFGACLAIAGVAGGYIIGSKHAEADYERLVFDLRRLLVIERDRARHAKVQYRRDITGRFTR